MTAEDVLLAIEDELYETPWINRGLALEVLQKALDEAHEEGYDDGRREGDES